MKCKSLLALRILLGLIVLAIGNGQTGGLGLVFQQIEAIGPRQWLNLMAGTITANTPAGLRLGHSLVPQPVPRAGHETAGEPSA
ncbi:MAG TPA: hypothetical protein VH678_26970 [Xanthobacteraceae bacterium]|jgi:hypothetical protein